MDERLARGREILAEQPFSVLLGAELTVWSEGRAELRVPISAKLKAHHGFVHGGVLSYLADNALAYAGGSVLGTAVVTSEFKINYLRPALGERLIARAAVVHAGKSQAVCRCDVLAVDKNVEKLCAVAQGTIARVSEDKDDL